jgi:hypothetical protein
MDYIQRTLETRRTTTRKNKKMTDLDKILEKHNNPPPTLYKIIHDELGYSHDCTAEIIDAVEKWLPKEDPKPSYATMQWDKCVRMMREKLE